MVRSEGKALDGQVYLALLALSPSWMGVTWLVSKARWFWNHDADLRFGWVVLVLCCYLFWESWEKRPEFRYRCTAKGMSLFISGTSLAFVVQIYQAACGTNAVSIVTLALAVMLVVAGNLDYLFGTRGIGHFAFSFGFLLVALPMPSILHNLVVGGLQSKVALINVQLLNLIGIPAQKSGNLIQLSNQVVGVDEACSGIRSLQSAAMATLFIGHLSLKRISSKILLIIAGAFLAFVGNLVRSFLLCFAAGDRGADALRDIHDPAGWSILVFTAVGVILVTRILFRIERRSFSRGGQTSCPLPESASSPKAAAN